MPSVAGYSGCVWTDVEPTSSHGSELFHIALSASSHEWLQSERSATDCRRVLPLGSPLRQSTHLVAEYGTAGHPSTHAKRIELFSALLAPVAALTAIYFGYQQTRIQREHVRLSLYATK
jgi:hypothetical protein